MTEKKAPLLYTDLLYVGKEFAKKFENDDGTVTKSYRYMFKRDENSQFSTNFWGYDNTKGADELEEGDVFTIGYVEKPNARGDKPIKCARFFGAPSEQGSQQDTQKKAVLPPAPQQTQAQAESKNNQLNPEIKGWVDDVVSQVDGFKASFLIDKPRLAKGNVDAFRSWVLSGDSGTDYFRKFDSDAVRNTEVEAVFMTICDLIGVKE